MPITIYDDLYLAEEAMIGLLKQVLPDANYVRDSDRSSSTPPERISVKAETKDIPGADIFEIDYSILIIAPGDAATPTDATRRLTVRTITNYLRTLQGGRALYFADLRCALHGPTLGRPEEGTCRDATEDKNNMDEIVLTCGGQRDVSAEQFYEDTESIVALGVFGEEGELSVAAVWDEGGAIYTATLAVSNDTPGGQILLPAASPPASPMKFVVRLTVLAGTVTPPNGDSALTMVGTDESFIVWPGDPPDLYVIGLEGVPVTAKTITFHMTRGPGATSAIQYAVDEITVS